MSANHRAKRALLAATTPLLLGALMSLPACNGGEGDDADSGQGCVGGKCDDAEGNVKEQLEGLDDPIAIFLKEHVDDDGVLDMDYLDMLRGISEQQGCTEEQIDSYVISDTLVVEGDDAFPRVVNTVCSTDRTKADLAFFALSFPNDDSSDISTRSIEMFAWDNTDRRYVFYKSEPVAGTDEAVQIEVEPAECMDCHLTPQNVEGHKMAMTPIMNELAAPWQHWHAEPVAFKHTVPDAIKDAPDYKRIAGADSQFLKSAARLEQTIRSGFNQRVAPARLRQRRTKPGDPLDAMALLRPLFCDEQVTYATEDGASGLLSAGAVVDDGWHSVFFQVQGTGWPWEWWNDRFLRLDPPGAPDMVTMMPIRGASVIAYEKQLLSSRALTPEQVAQIRALDWHTPVMSQFRCNLYHHALERVKANPPPVEDSTRNLHLMRDLVTEVLTIHPADFNVEGDLPESIPVAASEGKFAVLEVATSDSIAAFVEALNRGGGLGEATCGDGGTGFCELDLQGMGDLIEARFKGIEGGGRAGTLTNARSDRVCQALANYRSAPAIDGADCPEDPPPDDGGESDGESDSDSAGETDTDGDTDTDTDGNDTAVGGESEGPPPEGNCCDTGHGPGCENADVESCVCGEDDFCCDVDWDDQCVSEVVSFGCGSCD